MRSEQVNWSAGEHVASPVNLVVSDTEKVSLMASWNNRESQDNMESLNLLSVIDVNAKIKFVKQLNIIV